MILYENINGKSGIESYDYWNGYIKVKFNSWKIYTYTYASAWSENITKMINFANLWFWLNSYIVN